eukprot:RCo054240
MRHRWPTMTVLLASVQLVVLVSALLLGFLMGCARRWPEDSLDSTTALRRYIPPAAPLTSSEVGASEILACVLTTAKQSAHLKATLKSLFEMGYPEDSLTYLGIAEPLSPTPLALQEDGPSGSGPSSRLQGDAKALTEELRQEFPERRFQVLLLSPSWRKLAATPEMAAKLMFWKLLGVGQINTGVLLLHDDLRFCHGFWSLLRSSVSAVHRRAALQPPTLPPTCPQPPTPSSPRFLLSVYVHCSN